MSQAQLLTFHAERAAARERAEAKRKAMEDVSAEDILSLGLKRTLVSAAIEGVGRVYYYDPPSVAEGDAYHKHIRIDGEGTMRISLEGMVDGILARLKNKDGKPLFEQSQKPKLMQMSNEVIASIWTALKAEIATQEAAEKK